MTLLYYHLLVVLNSKRLAADADMDNGDNSRRLDVISVYFCFSCMNLAQSQKGSRFWITCSRSCNH